MPTIIIDGTTAAYADLAAATAALAAQAINCLGETDSGYSGTLSAAFTTTLDISANDSTAMSGRIAARFQVSGAETISTTYTVASDATTYAIQMDIYQDDGSTLVGTSTANNSASGTLTVATSSAGYYYVLLSWFNRPGTGGTFITVATSTGSTTYAHCGVRAAYGGTPDYLVCT